MKHNMNVSYKSFLFYYIPLALNRLSGAVKIKGLLWKLSDYEGGGGGLFSYLLLLILCHFLI